MLTFEAHVAKIRVQVFQIERAAELLKVALADFNQDSLDTQYPEPDNLEFRLEVIEDIECIQSLVDFDKLPPITR